MIKINPEIYKALEDYKIPLDDGISYLFCLYLSINPSYIPSDLKQKVNSTGIVIASLEGLNWRIPFLEQENINDNFSWVESEYLEVFRPFNKHNKFKRECTSRIKNLFATHPDIRKHEVIGAAQLYITQCQREGRLANYVRHPHYFISKGRGVDKIQEILTYVDLYRKENGGEQERVSKDITIS